MRREWMALVLASVACGALAQPGWNGKSEFAPNTVWRGAEDGEEKPWVEGSVPPPPALRTTGLVPIDVAGTALRFGVDPASVTVGDDGVIRYVVVATSTSGTVNAMHEGVRCATSEVRTYARHSPASGWVAASTATWQKLTVNSAATRHSATIARGGLCGADGTAGRTPAQVVRELRAGPRPQQ